MGNSFNSNKNEKRQLFTKEIFGMALILFSVLGLICLLFGDLIYPIGAVVRGFFLGVFGYYAIVFFILTIYLGISMVVTKPLIPKNARNTLLMFCLLLWAVFAIVHLSLSIKKGANFDSALSFVYGKSNKTFENSSFCGAFCTLILYPIMKFIGRVGAYLVLSALTGLCVFYFWRKISGKNPKPKTIREIKKKNKIKEVKTDVDDASETPVADLNGAEKPSAQKSDSKAQQTQVQPAQTSFATNTFQTNGFESEAHEPQKTPLFMAGGKDFVTRSQGDAEYYAPNVNLAFGKKEEAQKSFYPQDIPTATNRPISEAERNRTYIDSFVDDLDSKVKYIKTPPPIDIKNLGQSPMSAKNPSIRDEQPFTTEYSGYGDNIQRKDVYSMNNVDDENVRESFLNSDRISQASRSHETQSEHFEFGRDPYGRINPRDGINGGAENRTSFDNSRDLNGRTIARDGYRSVNPTNSANADGFNERNYNDGTPRVDSRFLRADFSAKDRLGQISRENSGYTDGAAVNPTNIAAENNLTSRVYNPSRVTSEVNPTRNVSERETPSYARNLTPSRDLNADTQQPINQGVTRGMINHNEDNPFGTIASDVTSAQKTETIVAKSNVTPKMFGEQTIAQPAQNAVNQAPTSAIPQAPVAPTRVSPMQTPVAPTRVASVVTAKAVTVNEVDASEDKPNPIDMIPANYRYKAPPLNLLKDYAMDTQAILADKEKQLARAETIVTTLGFKGIKAEVKEIIYGPTVTRFVISIPQGVPAKTVLQAQADLQLWLEASADIRILVPIYGTNKIGIEVPNAKPTMVGLKEIVGSKQFRNINSDSLSFALGKDIVGNPVILNILDMPHLIVAGATGTGKSVCLNSMLISMLYRYTPEDLRLVIVDPKVVEFDMYKGLPHLMFSDIFANDGRALSMLDWACREMDKRYLLFRDKGVRKIQEYNKKLTVGVDKKMPYIIILIDEFAELMNTATDKKKVENYVGRLAQKARAAGMSLIFATQRPSADVIDGTIKTNFTSRICFQTSSSTDSYVVLGETGAEKLLGKGDVMYKITTMPNIERAQGAFISDEEVKNITDYIRDNNKCYYDEKALELINQTAKPQESGESMAMSDGSETAGDANAVEDVFLRALRLVIMTRNVSKTSLQSKLSVGYPKAAKIIDWMEEQGFISSSIDNKTRTIYITKEEYEKRFGEFVESYK